MAKDYWVWLLYHPDEGHDVDVALKPWSKWGEVTGSGADAKEADISFAYGRYETALRKMDQMHRALRGIRHRLELVYIGDDAHDVIEKVAGGLAAPRRAAPRLGAKIPKKRISRRSGASGTKKTSVKKKTSKRSKAPAKRKTSKRTSKKTSKSSLHTFWWTRRDGTYGKVRATSVADAKRKKPGAKIHKKSPYGWM